MTAIATPSASILPKIPQTVAKGKTGTAKSKLPSASVAAVAKQLLNTPPKKIVAKKTTKERREAEAKKDAKTKAKKATRKANAVELAQPKRGYGLDDERAAELRKAKAFNGYREGSSYWAVVESLHSLGIGKMHHADKLVAEYQKTMDRDSMKAFKAKENRNEATGLGWKERILQNAYATTRQDYGKRMRDIGWEVRYEKTADGATYGLYRMGK
jgi:hypothetical protein